MKQFFTSSVCDGDDPTNTVVKKDKDFVSNQIWGWDYCLGKDRVRIAGVRKLLSM